MKKVCWMTLKCSVEPKRRDVAQIAVFSAEAEPIWRRDKKAVFGIVQRRNTLKSWYLTAAFLFALRGVSYGIASRDFVCQSPNQKPQIFLRLCSLRADRPQSPGKER